MTGSVINCRTYYFFVASTQSVTFRSTLHRVDKFKPLKIKPNMRVMQGVSPVLHREYIEDSRGAHKQIMSKMQSFLMTNATVRVLAAGL